MRVLSFLFALLFASSSAFAAVTPNSFVAPQKPTTGFVLFSNGDAANTNRTLYTAGANGSRCYSVIVTTFETSARDVRLYLATTGSAPTGGPMGLVDKIIPLTSGNADGVPAVNLLAYVPGLSVDAYGNTYIQLASGQSLTVTAEFTPVTNTAFYASCADF